MRVEGAGTSRLNGIYALNIPHTLHTGVDRNQSYYALQATAFSSTGAGLIDLYYNQDTGLGRFLQMVTRITSLTVFFAPGLYGAGEDPALSVSPWYLSSRDSTTTTTIIAVSSGTSKTSLECLAPLVSLLRELVADSSTDSSESSTESSPLIQRLS